MECTFLRAKTILIGGPHSHPEGQVSVELVCAGSAECQTSKISEMRLTKEWKSEIDRLQRKRRGGVLGCKDMRQRQFLSLCGYETHKRPQEEARRTKNTHLYSKSYSMTNLRIDLQSDTEDTISASGPWQSIFTALTSGNLVRRSTSVVAGTYINVNGDEKMRAT